MLEDRRLMAGGLSAAAASEVITFPPLHPPALTVLNTNDHGTGSLRQAILDADQSGRHGSPELIRFAIPGSGVHTIRLLSALPDITAPVILDGTTEPGYAGQPIIELDGSQAGFANGLRITAGHSTVRGLVIDHFQGSGIDLESNHNVIESNYIGTDASGTEAAGNGIGITVHGRHNRIGADGDGHNELPDRNVISGNDAAGVVLLGTLDQFQPRTFTREVKVTVYRSVPEVRILPDGSRITVIVQVPVEEVRPERVTIYRLDNQQNLVVGNFIGTDKTGTAPLGNGTIAHIKPVLVRVVRTIRVPVKRTVEEIRRLPDGRLETVTRTITEWRTETVQSYAFRDVIVTGPGGPGVEVVGNGNQIGGPGALANTIAYNGGAGVAVWTFNPPSGVVFEGYGNRVHGNSFHDNKGPAIDPGPTQDVVTDTYHVTVLNGHSGVLQVGGSEAVPQLDGSVQLVPFGTQISFIPIILRNGTIRMEVDVHLSAFNRSHHLSLDKDFHADLNLSDGQSYLLGQDPSLPLLVRITPHLNPAAGPQAVTLDVTVTEPREFAPPPRTLPTPPVTDILQLTALSGRPASLVLGGQQPVPQPGGGVQMVPFGTKLSFLPLVLGNGLIYLEVDAQVSKLDRTTGATFGHGAFVDGRLSDHVHTTLELADGASQVLGDDLGLPFSVLVTPHVGRSLTGLEEVTLDVSVTEPSALAAQPGKASSPREASATLKAASPLVTDQLQLTTLSGRSASLTLGGSQPVPQPGGGVQLVPFGTQLNFLPIVLNNGSIHLQVDMQVSKLDTAAGTTLGHGAFVAGRLSDEVHTSVELADGVSQILGADLGLPFYVRVTPHLKRSSTVPSEVTLDVTVIEPRALAPLPRKVSTPPVTDHLQLTALSGRLASLQLGGEQPVPQPGGVVQLVPFGTQLQFLPIVLGNGSIYLEVSAQVSKLNKDARTSLGHDEFVSGRLSDGVHTTVELADGASQVLGADLGLPFSVRVTPHVKRAMTGPPEVTLDVTLLEPHGLSVKKQ
jgi:Flp pilus assembly secretin CpaC